mgnify:CR=1 FL=1
MSRRFPAGVATGQMVTDIFEYAKENNFALPAVNVIGSSNANAVMETAAKLNSPVIIQFSNGGAGFYAGKGLKTSDAAVLGGISGANHVHTMAAAYGVPVILHTDHAAKKLLPWIDGLLEAGAKHFEKTGRPLFTSHMLDLSEEPLEENIEICVEYFKKMNALDMMIEIELGITGGEEDGVDNSDVDNALLYTQPEEVCYAHEELSKVGKLFTVAAAFGNVHGVYSAEPKIRFDIIEEVYKEVSVPLVLHGASGIGDEDIKKAIQCGIAKINIHTELCQAAREAINEHKDEPFLGVERAVHQAVKERAMYKIKLFGDDRRADE